MLGTHLFDYDLPEELIAQYPADKRDESRMMVLDPDSGNCEIKPFYEIVNYLNPGDLMVCNNTKVLRGRMYGVMLSLVVVFQMPSFAPSLRSL